MPRQLQNDAATKNIDATSHLTYIQPMTHEEALSNLIQCAGSQRRLASILGVSEEHISRWMKGKYPIPQWVLSFGEVMNKLRREDWPERWK